MKPLLCVFLLLLILLLSFRLRARSFLFGVI